MLRFSGLPFKKTVGRARFTSVPVYIYLFDQCVEF